MATDRVVVKDNWVDAVNDQISEFTATCVGWFILGGMIVTGAGMATGYMSTPKGQDPAPVMMERVAEYHQATWAWTFEAVGATWEAIQDARPEA